MRTTSAFALLFAIVLLGVNLRPALASISPIISQIQAATGLNDSMMGLLTTIPVLMMGIGNGLMPYLKRYISTSTGIFIGIALITLACGSRFAYSIPGLLLISSFVVGIGIAMVQSLLPGFIKSEFKQRTGFAMGLYTTAIMGGAAISSFASPYIAKQYDTQTALSLWCILAVIAGVFWLYLKTKESSISTTKNQYYKALPNRSIVLQLCLFFGLSTGAYTLVLAWLPDYYVALGWSEIAAGGLLSLVTLAEVVSGLAISFLIDRLPSRKPALFCAVGALIIGLVLLVFMPLKTVYGCCIVLGLGIGALFPLSLIVTVDHAKNSEQTIALSSIVQGCGYTLAALFPFIAGLIKQHLTNLSYAWIGMMVISSILLYLITQFKSTDNQ